MGVNLKKLITILAGFIHDFAAGCWASTVLAIYWIQGLETENPEFANILNTLGKDFFYFGLVCVGIVLITGMGRTFTYIENFYGEDTEKLRKKMLIAKHILLFVIFGIGTYWEYSMVILD